MIVERVAELVTSRLGRVDQSGLQQRTAGAVALFQASDHEPEKAGAGSAWCEIIGIEPVGDSGKSTVHVGVSMLLKRAPLITAVKQSYRLITVDNDFGLFRMLTAKRLNEGPYAGVTWVGDDWKTDALAPPEPADRASVTVQEQALRDEINTLNGGRAFTIDVTDIMSAHHASYANSPYVAIAAKMEVRVIRSRS